MKPLCDQVALFIGTEAVELPGPAGIAATWFYLNLGLSGASEEAAHAAAVSAAGSGFDSMREVCQGGPACVDSLH